MGKLIYGMFVSLGGFAEDEQSNFGWGAWEDEELHAYVNELGASLGTYLYGRRMYDVMVYWETALNEPDQPQVFVDYAMQWQAANKVVYSKTLSSPRSARTRIERQFEPEVVRQLKAGSEHDLSIDGPELAAQAIQAGLVDEFQMIVCPVLVGGGKRFFPAGARLELKQIDERRFRNGVVVLRYAVRS